jgi:hypothetical protein
LEMAKSKFILQGFTPRTHVEAVRRLFDVDEIERVILSVAFANQGGVELLAPQIESVSSKVMAFVGIRNPITSRQAFTSNDSLLRLASHRSKCFRGWRLHVDPRMYVLYLFLNVNRTFWRSKTVLR